MQDKARRNFAQRCITNQFGFFLVQGLQKLVEPASFLEIFPRVLWEWILLAILSWLSHRVQQMHQPRYTGAINLRYTAAHSMLLAYLQIDPVQNYFWIASLSEL